MPIEFPKRNGVVEFQNLGGLHRYHPCIKPVEELAFLIESLTRPGDIVLDWCCGLGSTLVAAQRLGRRYIGCDLSLNYSRIAMKRLADENKQVG